MRCLSLAENLSNIGAELFFICRKNPGDLREKIIKKGFQFFQLESNQQPSPDRRLFHSNWLTSTQERDARQTVEVIGKINADWLIVDHYAIDYEWEMKVGPAVRNIMVIDDLADRKHYCHVLLDQTPGRNPMHYANLVPDFCTLLLGPEFSLLRPEFASWRPFSMERRANSKFRNLLISMGGIDIENHTGKILHRLSALELPDGFHITVVLGCNAPHIEKVKMIAGSLNCSISILIDIQNMAEIMSNSDVAIGAAGTTSWERCCMGLPTIQFVLAENQQFLAKELVKRRAALIADDLDALQSLLTDAPKWIKKLSVSSARITDGKGANRVRNQLIGDCTTFKLPKFGEVKLVSYTKLSDCEQSFAREMRNHPSIKRWMYSQKKISKTEHRDFLVKLRNNQEKRYFLVKYKNEILGSINFSNIIQNETIDFGLFVNPFKKSKGAGKILEIAGNIYSHTIFGAKKIRLEVLSSNARAIKFYEKSNFFRIGSKNSLGREIYLMEKLINTGAYSDI